MDYENTERVVLSYLNSSGDPSNYFRPPALREEALLVLARVLTRRRKFQELVSLMVREALGLFRKRFEGAIVPVFNSFLKALKEDTEPDLQSKLSIAKIFSYYSKYSLIFLYSLFTIGSIIYNRKYYLLFVLFIVCIIYNRKYYL